MTSFFDKDINSSSLLSKDRSFRFYNNEGIYYPSVTTILGYGSDDQWYKDWESRIGVEEVAKLSKYYQDRGSLFHDLVEKSIIYNIRDVNTLIINHPIENCSKEVINGAIHLLVKMYRSHAIDNLYKLIASEKPIHYWIPNYGGYAGRFDMLVQDQLGNYALMDFKTSTKEKREMDIEGYFTQLSAYWYAIEKLTDIKISYAQNIIANDKTDNVQTFTVTKDMAREKIKVFAAKVKIFYDEVIPEMSTDLTYK